MSTFPRPPNIASNSQSPLDIKCSIEQRRMQPWPMRFIGAVFRARERVQPWTKGTRTSIPDSVGERLYLRSSRHFDLERFLNLHRKVAGKISPRYGKTLRLHDVSGTENLIHQDTAVASEQFKSQIVKIRKTGGIISREVLGSSILSVHLNCTLT